MRFGRWATAVSAVILNERRKCDGVSAHVLSGRGEEITKGEEITRGDEPIESRVKDFDRGGEPTQIV